MQFRAKRVLAILASIFGFALLVHIIVKIIGFIHLFGIFGDHAGIRTTQIDIALAHNATNPDMRPAVMPKIIHQIYHNWKNDGNNTLPSHWQAARQTCIDLNPQWEHKLWTTDDSRTFIEDEYPWFLPTYDGYKFPIQRVDVLRYFLLDYYGGIYIDLDNGCAESLEPLTYYPAFTTDGGHGALSNNIIGGQNGHPYFKLLTQNLIPYNWNLFLPYVIISYTSGQWFVTAMWEKYHSLLGVDGTVKGFDGNGWAPLNHILMDMRPGADPWVFFTQVRGGTWTNWDSGMFGWIGEHIIWILLGVAVLVGLVVWCCVWCCRRRKSAGYKALPTHKDEENGGD